MAVDPEFYDEFTELTKNQNAHPMSSHITNLLLFRLCRAVEALKVELVQVEMAKAEIMFSGMGNIDG